MAATARETTIVVASSNEAKVARLMNAFTESTAIGLLGIKQLDTENRFHPSEAGLQYEPDRAFAKAKAAQEITGRASLGWDDGLYVGATQIPGPDIKAAVGENPSAQQIHNYYQQMFESMPPERRKGAVKRSLCLVGADGTPFFTTLRIPVQFDPSQPLSEKPGNPLDSMIVPDGFDKPFSEFTAQDRQQYDKRLQGAVEDLSHEMYAREQGINTRRSLEINGKVWVFSHPLMHQYTEADALGVANLSGALAESYNGHPHGWVAKKYGTTDSNDLDPNGFFTKRRGLLLIGEPGDPFAMLSWVMKRGGSFKTNTLRVANDKQGGGWGRAIKQEMVDMAEALEVRKLYCTTSLQNAPALGLNESLGYRREAVFPGHYHPEKDEVILGKMLRRLPDQSDRSERMLLENGEPVQIGVRDIDFAQDAQGIRGLLTHLQGWHNDVGEDFIQNTLSGAVRGAEDIQGKGKRILVAQDADGQLSGTAILTMKMGGPAKIYPLVGTAPAQESLLDGITKVAKDLNSHVVYTFSPAWDEQQAEFLRSYGFEQRGEIESPYKPGANLIPWSMTI